MMAGKSGSDREKSFTSSWFINEAATWLAVVAVRSKRTLTLYGSARMISAPEGKSTLPGAADTRSEEHTSELQSLTNIVCRLLLEKKKQTISFSTSASSPH